MLIKSPLHPSQPRPAEELRPRVDRPSPDAPGPGKVQIVVTASALGSTRIDGYWGARIFFPPGSPTTRWVTEEELKALQADPHLTVSPK